MDITIKSFTCVLSCKENPTYWGLKHTKQENKYSERKKCNITSKLNLIQYNLIIQDNAFGMNPKKSYIYIYIYILNSYLVLSGMSNNQCLGLQGRQQALQCSITVTGDN